MSALMQSSLAPLVATLAWLGRQGTRAIAALVFIGIAIPPLGAVLKPYVTEAVFVLLCISFMRVDVAAMRGYLSRPALVIVATVWSAVVVPLLFGLGGVVSSFDKASPDLFLGLMLQAVASPMMASPALVALMGLDSTLVLITLVTSTALVPLTAPLFAWLFFGSALTLSPVALGLKLLAMLTGAILVAALIRRWVGAEAIVRHRQPIDGINILVLLVFVSAVMGTVAASFWAEPGRVLLLTAFAFAVFAVLLGVTLLVFRKAGQERALALGLMVSQRNMGLMLAATDGALPGLTWLYFALSQFPIYVSPQLLKPLARRLQETSTAPP
ncbi:MAG: Na+-dependent transporter [Afipia sp.]|nr:MAG: Na+-dependent transporter [Afipia sp.]